MTNKIVPKLNAMYLRKSTTLVHILLVILIGCLDGCQDATTTQGFLTDPVSLNPYPPYVWNPFEEWNMLNPDGSGTRTRMEYGYNASEMKDSLLTYRSATHICASRVVSLNVYISSNDTTRGALVFNTNLRRPDLPGRFPAGMNNNQNLGQAGDFFKFEVEVVFEGAEGCFYGQMISNFVSITETGRRIFEFHDDSPANQHDDIPTGVGATYPVVEKDTASSAAGNLQTTIRWIDGPERSTTTGVSVKQCVWIYAGACGIITDEIVLEIVTFTDGSPKIGLIRTGAEFRRSVGGITFNN